MAWRVFGAVTILGHRAALALDARLVRVMVGSCHMARFLRVIDDGRSS